MMTRLIAVGDVHGQLKMLEDLINQVKPTQDDQVVFLGDYIDRGPDSKGVIDYLIQFDQKLPQTIFLRGNHEQMFLDALVDLKVRKGERLEDISRLLKLENVDSSNSDPVAYTAGLKQLVSTGP